MGSETSKNKRYLLSNYRRDLQLYWIINLIGMQRLNPVQVPIPLVEVKRETISSVK